jgi:hypothetical protein
MLGWVAAAAVALVAGTVACDSRDDQPARWVSYSEPRFGWTIRYPGDWQFDTTTAVSRISTLHWTIASFDASSGPAVVHRERDGRGWTREWLELPDRLDDFPTDGVALRLGRRVGGPAPDYSLPEARFPLRLVDLGQAHEPVEPLGLGLGAWDTRRCARWTPPWCDRKPAPRLLRFAANGWTDFAAAVWIGPSANAGDQEMVARVLSSLRFEPVRPGQKTRSGYHVLGHESSFGRKAVRYMPVGQSGRFARGFFLLPKGDGFTALADPFECALRFEAQTRTLRCHAGFGQWDLEGRRLAGRGSRSGDLLQRYEARVNADGYVLVLYGGDVPLRRVG